jgi:hypothetical protein
MARRWVLAGIGVAFLAASLVAANLRFTHADTYCGAVFSDRDWGFVCRDSMTRAATASGALFVLGVVALLGAATMGRSGRDRMLAATSFGLALLGGLFLIGSVNRLVEPTDEDWCGSVLNRHRYYDAEKEHQCDAVLEPEVRRASVAGVLGVAAMAGAVVVDRRRRRGPDDGPDPELRGPYTGRSPTIVTRSM